MSYVEEVLPEDVGQVAPGIAHSLGHLCADKLLTFRQLPEGALIAWPRGPGQAPRGIQAGSRVPGQREGVAYLGEAIIALESKLENLMAEPSVANLVRGGCPLWNPRAVRGSWTMTNGCPGAV
jgi:hypothetical protein